MTSIEIIEMKIEMEPIRLRRTFSDLYCFTSISLVNQPLKLMKDLEESITILEAEILDLQTAIILIQTTLQQLQEKQIKNQ